MAKNGRKWVAAVFWSKMDSRAFCTMVIEVARKTMAEMAENGRKWWKKGHRGYLVGNGFWRFLRHSPTTLESIHLTTYQIVTMNFVFYILSQ